MSGGHEEDTENLKGISKYFNNRTIEGRANVLYFLF